MSQQRGFWSQQAGPITISFVGFWHKSVGFLHLGNTFKKKTVVHLNAAALSEIVKLSRIDRLQR